ncbi:MAG TPA: hypothetical protein PKC67_02310 [Kiritimatiellia bacterium]|nr:hypothetical protein [Kiritimatiellia bacterium]HMP33158.1 hypothetical protein [Kiritimatiellia bacterium]
MMPYKPAGSGDNLIQALQVSAVAPEMPTMSGIEMEAEPSKYAAPPSMPSGSNDTPEETPC